MHRRRRARPRTAALPALAVGVGLGLLLGAGPATAEDPMRLATDVTDTADVLGDRTGEVHDALDTLAEDTQYQLFVVYVDTFGGASAADWATDTAIASDLGRDDLLLAVAVEDRAYFVSVDDAIALTDAQLDAVATERIEPALSDDDWAGAAIAAADGYRDAALGGTGSAGGPGGNGLVTLLLVGLAVLAVILLVRTLRRRAPGSARPTQGPPSPDALPTAELGRRASSALVALDDAVTTSDQELGFAQAQFGPEQTAEFVDVVARARTALARAFTLRQRLDDAEPETEPQARALMLEIVALCDEADRALDAQAEAFDRLRDLHARAPQVLEETGRRAEEVARRLPAAQSALTTLAATYRPAALGSVRDNVAQATALLDGARAGVAQGLAAVTADRGTAVALARTAEDAVAQAVRLLDAVDRAGTDLSQADGRIDAALASLGADVADAARIAPADPAVRSAVTAAERALAAAPAERSTGDPLAALRSLVAAETALDAALAPARAFAEQAERARAQVSGLLGQLTSQVRAVADFIETRRGAVGAEARTRLAEAARLTQEAQQGAPSDPVAALAAAQRAQQLVASAQQLAEADVARWQSQQRGGGGYGGGGFGGNAGSLVLGGILLDQVLGGGRSSGGISGGFGGGSFGGGRGGGARSGGRPSGRSTGSFGGGGTRGRRGGGGRF
ncbi:MAG TPA: TPM domain-containing protein [Actinotalea sp.]|nr:TPM domain-containing protein [Actinotalea sp.]